MTTLPRPGLVPPSRITAKNLVCIFLFTSSLGTDRPAQLPVSTRSLKTRVGTLPARARRGTRLGPITARLRTDTCTPPQCRTATRSSNQIHHSVRRCMSLAWHAIDIISFLQMSKPGTLHTFLVPRKDMVRAFPRPPGPRPSILGATGCARPRASLRTRSSPTRISSTRISSTRFSPSYGWIRARSRSRK